ncbi:hypothetical protein ACTFIT_004369 [Dictyostelium discoideum]
MSNYNGDYHYNNEQQQQNHHQQYRSTTDNSAILNGGVSYDLLDSTNSARSNNPLLQGMGYEEDTFEEQQQQEIYSNNDNSGNNNSNNNNGASDKSYFTIYGNINNDAHNQTLTQHTDLEHVDLESDSKNIKYQQQQQQHQHQQHQQYQQQHQQHQQQNNNNNNNGYINPHLTESSQLFSSVPLNSLPNSPYHINYPYTNNNSNSNNSYNNTNSNNNNNGNDVYSENNNSNNNNNNSNNKKKYKKKSKRNIFKKKQDKESDLNKSNTPIIIKDNDDDDDNNNNNNEDNNDDNQRNSKVFIHKQHQSQVPDQYLAILKASHSAVQRKKRDAIALRVGRQWLTHIITVQTVGNLIRALPIFVLEKYYVMLLIFFQALFLVIGSYGVKRLKPYLILLYVIGCFSTTILDLIMTFTYAHTQSSRPFTEELLAFWSYVLFVSLLCILNIIGGILLGLKLFVSVVSLQDPSDNSLILLTASLVGSFDIERDESASSSSSQAKASRCIFFYGSDVKKAIATTTSITKKLTTGEKIKQYFKLKKLFPKSPFSSGHNNNNYNNNDNNIINNNNNNNGLNNNHNNNNNEQITSSVATSTDKSQLLSMKTNQVITSKYNVFTFIPKVIFYQFSRLANLYTLAIVILCMFSFSPVGPVSSLTPLLVVIAVTSFKELAEDLKRHKQDKEINGRETSIYRPPFYIISPTASKEDLKRRQSGFNGFISRIGNFFGSIKQQYIQTEKNIPMVPDNDYSKVGVFQSCHWEDIKVGDIIYVKNGESLPADIICLSSSRSDGRAYLETANLDGETNLKAKSSISKCQWIKGAKDLDDFSCKVDYEGPNNDIYSFDGVLTILKGFERSNIGDSTVVPTTNYVPVSIDQLLLRGTKLRNTDWVIGVVTYSGVDTKIEKNASKASQKRSSVERGVNNKLLILFLLQTIICIICSIGHNRWHLEDDKDAKPWYIDYDPEQTEDFIYVSYVILYNTLIPLSMYVSMEMIRVSNAHFIDSDLEMYDESTDTPAQARNTNINEELGQIQYLFSDKTGTLTCNEMVFNRCTIGGQVYGPEDSSLQDLRLFIKNQLSDSSNGSYLRQSNGLSGGGSGSGGSGGSGGDASSSLNPLGIPVQPEISIPILSDQTEYIKEFLTCLAICNTVLIEKNKEIDDLMMNHDNSKSHHNFNGGTNSGCSVIPKYQAASPDEESLTLTAARYGFILKSREDNIITISVHGREERFELLNVLEFNSYRKRMSVIVKNQKNQIKIYCKGADSVIFERAKKNTDHCVGILQSTEKHLSEFACSGLRTLCMSVRTIEHEEYIAWNKIHQEASISLVKKAEKVDAACELIEKDLLLIGSTGIEDRLQDHVPETISALREAGIKVWVLTGDKQETAISISTSSAVINEEMELIILNESNKQALMKRLLTISNEKRLHHFNDMSGRWGSVKYLSKLLEKVASKLRLEPSDAPNLLNKSNGMSAPAVNASQKHIAIIIDGSTLALALEPDLRYFFLQVAKTCESVVCCRCSPSQKAKVVNLVAERSFLFGDGAITMSIGDGANDVPMIQKAHVGVGISGREGMQAVLASDFAIANFSMLRRLILVHGNRSYKRMTKLILYSFSKNIALSISQFWFGFFSGFSGQMIYFDFLFTLYNALFTSLPVIFLGTFDQDTKEDDLLNKPYLYRVCQSNSPFSTWKFIWWVFIGMWQSATIFFVTFFVMNTSTIEGGKTLGLWSIGTAAYIYLVVTVNLQISFITRYWTRQTILAVSISVVSTFLFVMLYSVLGRYVEADATHIIFELYALPTFWLLLIIAPSIALLPYIIVSLNSWLFNTDNLSLQKLNLEKKGFIMMNDL